MKIPLIKQKLECGLIDDSTGLRTFSLGKGDYYKKIEPLTSFYKRKVNRVGRIIKRKLLFWKKDKTEEPKIQREISEWKFWIYDWKQEAPVPPNCGSCIQAGGGKVPFFYRDLNSKTFFCKIKFNKKSGNVKQIEPDVQMWGYRARKKLILTYTFKDWWDKYKDAIMFFGSAVLALVLVYLLIKKVDILTVLGDIIKSSAETIKASSIINSTTGAP